MISFLLPVLTFLVAGVVGALSHITTTEIVFRLNACRPAADQIDPLFWYPGKWSSVRRAYLAAGLSPKLLARRTYLAMASFALFALGVVQLFVWHVKRS